MSFFLSYLGTVSLQAGRFEQALEQAGTALTLRQELDMRLNTTDDLTTLAATHLAAGDMVEALAYAEQALTILKECKGEGPEFPQRDYFICHQVLATAGQTERAQAALQSAYDLVITQAQKITDPTLRQSFLENVAINREIVATYGTVIPSK
jgi:tetratricopeptide (TPR) repeat protein